MKYTIEIPLILVLTIDASSDLQAVNKAFQQLHQIKKTMPNLTDNFDSTDNWTIYEGDDMTQC